MTEVMLLDPKFIKMYPSVLIGAKLVSLSILCGEEARVENDFFANGEKIVDILVVPDKVCKEIAIIDCLMMLAILHSLGSHRAFMLSSLVVISCGVGCPH